MDIINRSHNFRVLLNGKQNGPCRLCLQGSSVEEDETQQTWPYLNVNRCKYRSVACPSGVRPTVVPIVRRWPFCDHQPFLSMPNWMVIDLGLLAALSTANSTSSPLPLPSSPDSDRFSDSYRKNLSSSLVYVVSHYKAWRCHGNVIRLGNTPHARLIPPKLMIVFLFLYIYIFATDNRSRNDGNYILHYG